MSTLTGSIKSNLNTLYRSKNEYDWLMTQKDIAVIKVDRIIKLKKEMTYSLSTILSAMSDDMISNSFYISVNEVEQAILELLKEKQNKLDLIEKPYKLNMCDAKRVMSFVYSMEILENYTHISIRNEEKLLELKNTYIVIDNAKQKEIALNYILNLLKEYKEGIRKILKLIYAHNYKSELSLENKQDLSVIFSNISLGLKESKVRNKIYNEDKENKEYIHLTKDYFKFYEELFLDLVKTCDFVLPEFYIKIENDIENIDLNEKYIDMLSDFICEKYEYDLKNEIVKLQDIQNVNTFKIKDLIMSLIKGNRVPNSNVLLNQIKNTAMLPNYLIDTKEYKTIYDVATNTDFLFNDEVQIGMVVDDVSKKILEKFDSAEFIKGYKYNKNDVIRQVAHFRQYYILVLEEVKKELLKVYEQRIENVISNSNLKEYNIKEEINKISDIKIEIRFLQNALKYINTNFREFTKNNLKIYTKAIQKRYYVEDLYEILEKRNSKKKFFSKAKKIVEKEKEYLKSFIQKDIIKHDLCNEIIENVIFDNDLLKDEILEKIV